MEAFRADKIRLPRAWVGCAADHVSLRLDAGEIIGIYGVKGVRHTECVDCVMGRHPNSAGMIVVEGEPVVTRHDVATRIRLGLALILSIATHLTLACLPKFTAGFHVERKAEESAIKRFVTDLAAKVAKPSGEVSSLSGRNQRKVVTGKMLMTEPEVLLMEEASRGIDVGARADVFKSMRKLPAEGLGILFTTSAWVRSWPCRARSG